MSHDPTPELVGPSRHSPPVRALLLVGGTLALVLGVIGVVLPLLPTTPFVLLAAGCYSRAWAPAHRWLRANRFFGPICRSGVEGRYLPPRAKAFAIVLTVISFGATIVHAVSAWWLRVLLGAVGLLVLAWLIRLPTKPKPRPRPGPRPLQDERS